jgi:hypothetical protein
MLRLRKSVNSLTATEKANLVAAIKALKASGKYDQYVNEHLNAMNTATLMPGEVGDSNYRNVAHRGPAFGPWHREMLRRFELDLQAEVPGVTLPYWDWAVDATLADPKSSAVWGTDLMGGDGDPANAGMVSTGPFRYDAADPTTWTVVAGGGDPGPGLRRTLGTGAPALPSQPEIDTVAGITPYDSAPWRTISDPSFRNQLEGWMGPNLHNRVHVWVGGSMLPGTSPNDPVFFLHHCNVDRLWWQWQQDHPGDGYVPVSAGPPGHNLNDQMTPWDAATTPASTLDIHRLGYRYDTDAQMQISFLIDQSTFSQDEVELQLPGVATFAAGWIAVDGLTPSDLSLTTSNLGNPPAASVPTITFTLDPTLDPNETAAIQGMLQQPACSGPVIPENPALPDVPQRFLFPFVIRFNNDAGFLAMTTGGLTSTNITLSASLSVPAGDFEASAQIELTTGEDPRFVDVDPQHPLAYPSWLSFDLRFFTMTVPPGGMASRFGAQITGPSDAPAFIAQVIEKLTAGGGVIGSDSFDPGLTQDEDATKLEFQPADNAGNAVFNFAVARVRLLAQSAATARKVRVFFRLFQAQNTVSNFTETTTYRYWSDGATFGRKIPLAGVQPDQHGQLEYVTIPCFATERIHLADPTKSMADQTDDPNVYDLPTDPGHEKDYFFGCWIDNNQTVGILPRSLPSGSPPAPGQTSQALDGPWDPSVPLGSMKDAMTAFPHQCLIAEIRYDDTPIPAGATTSTSDKLAQRNIAWLDGPNPGAHASRRMSHPVQIRPTPPASPDPDELMILWGNTPAGATAELFLPALDASAVVAQEERRTGLNPLSVVDPHTVGCQTGGVTFIPLPRGSSLTAGLLTVDLPQGVRKGDEYTIDVRQVTRASGLVVPPPPPPQIQAQELGRRPAVVQPEQIAWRRVEGSFRFALVISTKEQLLLSEERLLAVLRWMQSRTPRTRRWYPVLHRYIETVAGRVEGFGGNPATIKPSPTGQVPGWPPGEPGPAPQQECRRAERVTGKVECIIYDHFGDFEGFIVEDRTGHHHRYRSREKPLLAVVERAWLERQRVTVISEPHRADIPHSIMLTLAAWDDQHRCCDACRCEPVCHCTTKARCCPECTCV